MDAWRPPPGDSSGETRRIPVAHGNSTVPVGVAGDSGGCVDVDRPADDGSLCVHRDGDAGNLTALGRRVGFFFLSYLPLPPPGGGLGSRGTVRKLGACALLLRSCRLLSLHYHLRYAGVNGTEEWI